MGRDAAAVGRLGPTGTPWDNAIIVPVEAVWLVHALSSGHPEVRTIRLPIPSSLWC